MTNHTGRAADGTPTIDLLVGQPDFTLVSLFSPEHGIRGIVDEDVPSSKDEKTGLVIHSLYGPTRRPTDEMLEGIDTLVIDLQDVGVRFYTYGTTMAYVMEEAAKRKIRVVVLDRPNPIGGWQIEGPALDKAAIGFTGYIASMPTRHGMTLGELAKLFNAEAKIGCDLDVVAMRHWSRDRWFDELGLEWINPSPNMRNLLQATLYPGIGSIEYGNLSVGRGTDTPFEQIGAPWIDGRRLAAHLNARTAARHSRLPGVLHADLEQVRWGALSGRVLRRHRSGGAQARASWSGGGGGAVRAAPGRVRSGPHVDPAGLERRARRVSGRARIRLTSPRPGPSPSRDGERCGRNISLLLTYSTSDTHH